MQLNQGLITFLIPIIYTFKKALEQFIDQRKKSNRNYKNTQKKIIIYIKNQRKLKALNNII